MLTNGISNCTAHLFTQILNLQFSAPRQVDDDGYAHNSSRSNRNIAVKSASEFDYEKRPKSILHDADDHDSGSSRYTDGDESDNANVQVVPHNDGPSDSNSSRSKR
jgi:hypothetical protein